MWGVGRESEILEFSMFWGKWVCDSVKRLPGLTGKAWESEEFTTLGRKDLWLVDTRESGK